MNKPQLNAGEVYAGAFILPDGTGHHTILLPGDNDDADWETQMEWAKSIGGDLPDNVEQAHFFKYLPEQFKSDWYWSNPLCGTKYRGLVKSYHGENPRTQARARAVRRVAI